jgi:hypothetical protein
MKRTVPKNPYNMMTSEARRGSFGRGRSFGTFAGSFPALQP